MNAFSSALERVLGRHAAVGVRERHAVDLGRERAEARLVGVHLRGQREREHRAPVERAVERDHRRAARVGARELDGVLDGLGAGVEERGLDRPRDRHALAQALGELRVRLVGDDREIGVSEPVELLVRRRDDVRVAVPDVQAADAASEVDERVPIYIRQRRSPCGGRHDRERDRERPRDVALDPLPDLLRPRPRNLGDEVDHTRRSHKRSVANTPERPDSGALAGSRLPTHNPAPPPRVGMPTRHPQCQFYEVGGRVSVPSSCQASPQSGDASRPRRSVSAAARERSAATKKRRGRLVGGPFSVTDLVFVGALPADFLFLGGALARYPPRWLDDSPSGPGDTPLRASTSTARTGNLHLPDHLLSAVNSIVTRRSRVMSPRARCPWER